MGGYTARTQSNSTLTVLVSSNSEKSTGQHTAGTMFEPPSQESKAETLSAEKRTVQKHMHDTVHEQNAVVFLQTLAMCAESVRHTRFKLCHFYLRNCVTKPTNQRAVINQSENRRRYLISLAISSPSPSPSSLPTRR